MKKKSQASIISIVLIILLVLVAILIVWNVINPMMSKSSEGIFAGRILVNFEVKDVNIPNENSFNIKLKRNLGKGDLSKLKFVSWDGKNSCVKEIETNLQEYAVKKFDINCSGTGINMSKLEEIRLAPLVKNKDGKEILGREVVVYKVGEDVGSNHCVPDCTGKRCGDDGCGGSCGSCSGDKVCDEGICVDCINNGDCETGKVCQSNTCVPTPTEKTDWPTFKQNSQRTGYTSDEGVADIGHSKITTFNLFSATSYPVVDGESIYVGRGSDAGDYKLYELNASNITQIISFASVTWAISCIAVNDDYIYVSATDGKLHQFNKTDLSQKAIYEITGSYIKMSSPLVQGDSVYVGTYENGNKVYQLNAENISQKKAEFVRQDVAGGSPKGFYGAPAYYNGYIYVTEALTRSIYKLDANNISNTIASYKIEDITHRIQSTPVIYNNHVYFVDNQGILYKLNTNLEANSVVKFNLINPKEGFIMINSLSEKSSPVIANGFIYVQMGYFATLLADWSDIRKTILYQLNATNLTEFSRYEIDSASSQENTAPAVTDDYVYFVANNTFYQVSASNISNLIGSYHLGASGLTINSPAISGNSIYIATQRDGLVHFTNL